MSPDDKPTKSSLIGRILSIGDDLRSGEKVPGSEHQSQEAKALGTPMSAGKGYSRQNN